MRRNAKHIAIEEALKEARRSMLKRQHGAVLVDNRTGRIIAKGHNKCHYAGKTYREAYGENRTIHAEADVICQVPKLILPKTTLYVVRLPVGLFFNNIDIDDCLNSAPCPKCKAMIIRAKIPMIFYS